MSTIRETWNKFFVSDLNYKYKTIKIKMKWNKRKEKREKEDASSPRKQSETMTTTKAQNNLKSNTNKHLDGSEYYASPRPGCQKFWVTNCICWGNYTFATQNQLEFG